MGVKAQLKIILRANDIEVAESEDAALWQYVLQKISAPRVEEAGEVVQPETPVRMEQQESPVSPRVDSALSDSALGSVAKFARMLNVPEDVVRGSCDPRCEEPLLHLNLHHWEALKKATPVRGPGSIAPVTLVATLLVLWCDSAGLPPPTKADLNSVLGTIHLRDKNPNRSLKNCEWLQLRGPQFMLNPAEISKAIALAAAYCRKEAPKGID
jgi:hypothetical protein